MQSFFSFHVIAAFVLLAIAIGVPTWIVVRYAKGVAPALTTPVKGVTAGFGGVMILFALGQVAWVVRALWEGTYMASELWFVLARAPESLTNILVAVLPTLFGVVLGVSVLWLMAAKRTPSALAAVVIMLWVMGPTTAMLQSWYFGLELTTFSLVEIFGWTILWTAYIALSPRVALTYGTARGRKMVEDALKAQA